jgi:hypothetical protein
MHRFGFSVHSRRRPHVNSATQIWRAIGLVLLLCTGGCESIQTNCDFNPVVDFSTYHTFSWISDNPMIAASPTVSPMTQGRVQLAIIDVLQQKGITYVSNPAQADFVVSFTAGTHQQVRVDTTSYPIGYQGPWAWGMGYYQDIEVREYQQGRLSIDMFDTKLRQPVWHGWGSKNITGSDQKRLLARVGREPAAMIHKAVEAILKDFPPAKKS